jgi:hypothetical protein
VRDERKPQRRAPSGEREMNIAARLLFLLVGVINALPVVGVLGAAQLESLYGQPVDDPDLLLLMRHRAVLFGLLGGLLIAAAFRPGLRTVATLAGGISMSAFCFLALPLESHGASLQRVFWADVVALPMLAIAWWLSRSPEDRAKPVER